MQKVIKNTETKSCPVKLISCCPEHDVKLLWCCQENDIVSEAAICVVAINFFCLVVPKPAVKLTCTLSRWKVFHVMCKIMETMYYVKLATGHWVSETQKCLINENNNINKKVKWWTIPRSPMHWNRPNPNASNRRPDLAFTICITWKKQ